MPVFDKSHMEMCGQKFWTEEVIFTPADANHTTATEGLTICTARNPLDSLWIRIKKGKAF